MEVREYQGTGEENSEKSRELLRTQEKSREVPMTFYLIDVSKYNQPVDFVKVRNAGIQGAICKATDGVAGNTSSSTRAIFTLYSRAIKATGFPVWGAYHYLQPGNSASQAENFYQAVKAGYGTLDGCLLQLDAEEAGLTLGDVRGFLAAWNSLSGAYPLVGYFPRWFWEPKVSGATLNSGFHGWWQSAYVTPNSGTYQQAAARITNGWNAWDGITPTILQYASGCSVPGVTGNCDVNQVQMSIAAFKAKTTRASIPVIPIVQDVEEGEDEVKLIQVSGDAAIWATFGFTRRHVGSMDAVADVEKQYGVKVLTDASPDTLKLYDDLDAPQS